MSTYQSKVRLRALMLLLAAFALVASACGDGWPGEDRSEKADSTENSDGTTTTVPEEELGPFNPADHPEAEVAPPGEIPTIEVELGQIHTGGCWPKDERVDTDPNTNLVGFAESNGQLEAAVYLKGNDPRDLSHIGRDVALRYHNFFAQHRDYYEYNGQSAEDFASYVEDKLVAIQLPYDIVVTNHRCSGPNVEFWRIQRFPKGEWIYFLKGREPGNPEGREIRPVIKGACGNPLLPPPPQGEKPPETMTLPPSPPSTIGPPTTTLPPTTCPSTICKGPVPSAPPPCVDNLGVTCTQQPGAGGQSGNGGAVEHGDDGYSLTDPPPSTTVTTVPPPMSTVPPPPTSVPPPPNSTLPPPPG